MMISFDYLITDIHIQINIDKIVITAKDIIVITTIIATAIITIVLDMHIHHRLR